MRDPLRWAGRWHTAVTVSAAAAVVVLAVFTAWTLFVQSGLLAGEIRQGIVARLSAGMGRPVALGTISGDPLRGIDLRDLVIAEKGGFSQGVAFSADRIHLILDMRVLIFNPQAVLESVRRADIFTPFLTVTRGGAGAWNLEELFTHARSPLGTQFHGRIVLHDGIVAYSDSFDIAATPFTTQFRRVNGEVDFRQRRQVSVALAARSTDGEDATVRGRYLPDGGTYDLDITAENGAAQHWGGYLVRLTEIRWAGGRFGGHVHVLATPSINGEEQRAGLIMDYTGALHLQDAEADYVPTHMRLRHISGWLALATDHTSTGGLTLTVNGSPLLVRGDVAYPGGAWLDLFVSSPGLDLSSVRSLFFPDAQIGLAGQASGDVWITGAAGAPYLDGDIRSAGGRFNREAFQALSARFQYAGGTLTLSDLSVSLGNGRVSGDAIVSLSGGGSSWLIDATAENVDASSFASAGLPITDGVTGQVTGDVVGVGGGDGVQLMADVAMASGVARGQPFHDLHALFWEDRGAVDIDFLRAGIGSTTLYSAGHISTAGSLDLSLVARGVHLNELGVQTALGGSGLQGEVDFQGSLRGTAAAPVASGTVTAWDGRIGPVPFSLAQGDLTVTPSGVSSRHLDLMQGEASYHIRGGVLFRPLVAQNLHVDAEGVDAASLARDLSLSQDITGTLSAHVTLTGPLAHPSGSGQIALVEGSLAGRSIDSAAARLTADGRRVQVLSFDAQRNGSRVHAAGTIDLSGPLDLRVSGDAIQIADLTAGLNTVVAPRGTLTLAGEVVGTLASPEVRAQLTAQDLTIGAQAFDAAGVIDYQAGLLRVSPLTLIQGPGRYSLSGDVRLRADPYVNLALDVQHGQIGTIANAANLQLPAPAAGTIDGRITLTGPMSDPSASLSLAMSDGEVGGVPLGTGTADLTLRHGLVDIHRLDLSPGQGQIAAVGRIALAGASSVEVSASNVDPNILRPLFHFTQPLVGRLNFTMQWSGPTRSPTAGLSLEATNIGVPGVVADRIVGLAYYKDGTIHIDDATIAKGPHKVVIQGSLPVLAGSFTLDPQGPIDLGLHLQDADLSFLSLLTPRVQDASGTVRGQVSIGGTVGNPQMSGSIQAQGGHMRVTPMQSPFENVNVDIAFSQDQILVRALSATVGGGTVETHGTIAVSDFRPQTVALDVNAQHAIVDVPGLYAGQVDGTLALTGPVPHPVLFGTLGLTHGRVAIDPGSFTPAGGAVTPIGLDLSIRAGDDVTLDEGPVRAQLGGAIHVGGTMGTPSLSGTVQSLGGVLDILGTPFTITEGQAAFSEALGFEPQVHARAQAIYGETRVYLDVNGVLPNPTLAWSSDPPLNQAEILSLVAGSGSITGSPAVLFGGRMLLGSLGQAIQRALHLDEFSISYDTQNPVTLRIGKYIVRNVFLSLEEVFAGQSVTPGAPAPAVPGPGLLTRLNYSGQQYTVFGLEYFLTHNLFLSYSVDTLGDNGIFLLTRIPF
jgi:translocation and assembly module TamB